MLVTTRETTLVTTREEAIIPLTDLSLEKIIAVDTETTGLVPLECELVTVQIATMHHCYIFIGKAINENLKLILEDPDIMKLVQYAPFDWAFLKHELNIDMKPYYDTRDMEKQLINGSKRRGLKTLAKKYAKIDLDKTVATSFRNIGSPSDITPQQLDYASMDAFVLFDISIKQWEQMKLQDPAIAILPNYNAWIAELRKSFHEKPCQHQAMKDYLNGRGPFPTRPN